MNAVWLLLLGFVPAMAGEAASLIADRTAIERVYYQHRLGEKPPFEQILPPAMLANLVRLDLHKEALLRQAYGVEITAEMLDAEVRRITTTTRAPEILAEIKAALGDDPARFANVFAKPILVERLLRAKFDNDDTLHAPQRALATQARENLLAGQSAVEMREVTWLLTPRPVEDTPPPAATPPSTKGNASSGAYSVEATAQLSQVLTAPGRDTPGRDEFYFEDLDPELQKVLQAQLQKAGDVSAVIETPGVFLVYLAKEKTAASLCVNVLSFPKRSYEEWLAGKADEKRK